MLTIIETISRTLIKIPTIMTRTDPSILHDGSDVVDIELLVTIVASVAAAKVLLWSVLVSALLG